MNFIKICLVVIGLTTVLPEVLAMSVAQIKPLIVNGQAATAGQIPYQIRITATTPGKSTQYCGGVIIAANWVLTAAHCVYISGTLVGTFKLEAGNLIAGTPGANGQVRTVTALGNTYPNPGFNLATLIYDMALIRVPTPFNITGPYVQAVPLPSSTLDVTTLEGAQLTVSGFGLTSTGGSLSTTLQYAYLVIISSDTCQSYFTPTIPYTSFCGQGANNPPSSICNGDSGGPATANVNNVTTLVGIVSFASSTGCGYMPQGFTNIPMCMNWISSTAV